MKTYDISSRFVIDPSKDQTFNPGFDLNLTWVDSADLNRDGFDELIVAGHNSTVNAARTGAVYRVDSNGAVSLATDIISLAEFPDTVWPRWMLFDDYNGDGFNDVFIAAHGWDYAPFPGEPNVLLLSNGKGGLTSAPVPFIPTEFSHSAASGDIDGDGDLDIYVGNVASQNIAPYLMINDGKGGFTLDRSRLPSSVVASDGRQPWEADWFDSVRFVDVNGDKAVDMILGKFPTSPGAGALTSRVYLNNGQGGYSDSARLDLPHPKTNGLQATAYDIDALDLDGDGDQDLIVTYTPSQDVRGWELQVLINDGTGRFSDQTASHFRPGEEHQSNVGYFLSFLDPMDINNDGFVDLVADYIGIETPITAPAFWLNDGTGKFAAILNSELYPANYQFLAGRQVAVTTADGVEFITPFLFNGNFINTPLNLKGPVSTGPYGTNAADQGAAGFNELYYLNQNADAAAAVASGAYATGLAHYLAVGQQAGRSGMANGAQVTGTEGADTWTSALGNSVIRLLGGDDRLTASAGNETIEGGAGNDTIDGGAGYDVALLKIARAEATVNVTGTTTKTTTVISAALGTDTYQNVERITFNDAILAFDLTGSAGQTFRLYRAAFNREPDQVGLSHNVKIMDKGFSIFDMANAFIASAEFQQTYGSNIDNTTFLTLLYRNVLDRAPDTAGLNGWLSQLDSGQTDRQHVLFGFSESAENKTATAALTDNGIWLI